MTNFEKVGLFMKTFGQEVKSKPGLSNVKINKLRIDLIDEELKELKSWYDHWQSTVHNGTQTDGSQSIKLRRHRHI